MVNKYTTNGQHAITDVKTIDEWWQEVKDTPRMKSALRAYYQVMLESIETMTYRVERYHETDPVQSESVVGWSNAWKLAWEHLDQGGYRTVIYSPNDDGTERKVFDSAEDKHAGEDTADGSETD